MTVTLTCASEHAMSRPADSGVKVKTQAAVNATTCNTFFAVQQCSHSHVLMTSEHRYTGSSTHVMAHA